MSTQAESLESGQVSVHYTDRFDDMKQNDSIQEVLPEIEERPASVSSARKEERMQVLLEDADTVKDIDHQLQFLKEIIDENIAEHVMRK